MREGDPYYSDPAGLPADTTTELTGLVAGQQHRPVLPSPEMQRELRELTQQQADTAYRRLLEAPPMDTLEELAVCEDAKECCCAGRAKSEGPADECIAKVWADRPDVRALWEGSYEDEDARLMATLRARAVDAIASNPITLIRSRPEPQLRYRPAHPYDPSRQFATRPPIGDQPRRSRLLRESGMQLAELIVELVPASAERMLALRKVEEACMWAVRAMEVNEGGEDGEGGGEG